MYISIIPLIVIIGLILGAGYLLLGEDIKLPKLNGEPKITRLEGFPTNLGVQKDMDKKRITIHNEEELNQFLNEVDSAGLLTTKDNINFDKQILVGASTKTLDEEGHTFKIRKVYKDEESRKLLVSLVRTDPDETCETTKDKNIWIDLVAIDKTDWDIDFELVKKIEDCD